MWLSKIVKSNLLQPIKLVLIINILLFVTGAEACGPGRGHFKRSRLRKLRPLVQHECVPNVSENTLAASGRAEGPIIRGTKRFRELVQNLNPDIVFRDDEKTGADRMMTQRLKERLSILAIIVMNQWPNVRLRVIEGWDEDRKHAANSLHYEGRAVDITTSDKDKSKYGMLAKLAVEAGFDWVHYEARSHVHCSVKIERPDMIRNNGCFDATSRVRTPDGDVEMSQLQVNDLVLTMDSQTGVLQYNPVIMWLDRDEQAEQVFVRLQTKGNRTILLTQSHLIYVTDEPPDLNNDLLTNQVNTNHLSERVAQQATINKMKDITQQYDAREPQILKSGSNVDSYYYYDTKEPTNNKDPNIYVDSGLLSQSSATSSAKPSKAHGEQTESKINNTSIPTSDDLDSKSMFAAKNKDNYIEQQMTSNYYKSSQLGRVTGGNQNRLVFEQTKGLNVDCFAETTYARNAAVGQYLLVYVSPEEQLGNIHLTKKSSNRPNSDSSKILGAFKTKSRPINSNTIESHKEEQILAPSRSVFPTELERMQIAARLHGIDKINIKPPTVKFDQIVSVDYITKRGIYAPLTREGNIVVNSVVSSCYAMVNHKLAHMAFAPYRWYTYLDEWIFGLRTITPTRYRTVDAIGTQAINLSVERSNQDQQQIDQETYEDIPGSKESRTMTDRVIHWYPAMLYSIARYFVPNYLF